MKFDTLAALVSTVLLAPGLLMAQEARTCGGEGLTGIVRLLLSDKQLRQYLPDPGAPPRLKLALGSGMYVNTAEDGIDAEVVSPQSADARDAVLIEAVAYRHPGATLRFRYPPQGLRGTARFTCNQQPAGWALASITIFET